MTWQRYNKNLRKSLLLAEYFSFWTINHYSEDIVKAWLDNEKKIGDGSADLHIFFFCFYYG